MPMKQFLSAALVATGMVGFAAAQDEPVADTPAPEEAPWSPSWPDAEIGEVAEMLSGTWKTADSVSEWGEQADGSAQLVMQVAAVPTDEGTMLYAETARADQMEQPYRQTLMALYRYKGDIRLRTYELKMTDEGLGALVGLWAAPQFFPVMGLDGMIATLDVQLEPTNGGFSGSTPYPYPTGVGGAVEMTSEVQLTGDRMVTADRGLDADGGVVWGAEQGGEWVWNKIENPVSVRDMGQGIIALDFVRPEGETNKPGDRVFVHYSGWTGDGNRFDSSRPRGTPFDPVIPMPGGLIEGWNLGLLDMTVGTKRRLIIPSAAGYGERGQPRASILPHQDLFFEVELMGYQSPEAPAEQPVVDPHEGHDHP